MTFSILSITCFVSIIHNGKLAGVSCLMFKHLIIKVLTYVNVTSAIVIVIIIIIIIIVIIIQPYTIPVLDLAVLSVQDLDVDLFKDRIRVDERL